MHPCPECGVIPFLRQRVPCPVCVCQARGHDWSPWQTTPVTPQLPVAKRVRWCRLCGSAEGRRATEAVAR